jgi:DNA polymerase III sliding clamp (beta) subunit (PCNA family)
MRKKVKKKKVEAESTWFNRPVFYALGVLALASTITACTLLTKVILDDQEKVPLVVVPGPELPIVITEEDDSKEPGVAMISAADLDAIYAALANHFETSHRLGDKEILFKCHKLAGTLYSCKIVQGESPNLESSEIPIVDNNKEPQVEKESEKWDPFK